jgi:hypothetical protein
MITRRALNAIARTLGDELAFHGLGRIDTLEVALSVVHRLAENGDLTPHYSGDKFSNVVREAWDAFHANSIQEDTSWPTGPN